MAGRRGRNGRPHRIQDLHDAAGPRHRRRRRGLWTGALDPECRSRGSSSRYLCKWQQVIHSPVTTGSGHPPDGQSARRRVGRIFAEGWPSGRRMFSQQVWLNLCDGQSLERTASIALDIQPADELGCRSRDVPAQNWGGHFTHQDLGGLEDHVERHLTLGASSRGRKELSRTGCPLRGCGDLAGITLLPIRAMMRANPVPRP